MEDEERAYHFNKRPGKTYVSKGFNDTNAGAKIRIASKVIDGEGGLAFAKIADEIILRVTPKQRHEIKATFLEDDRSIRTLTLQKFSANSGPSKNEHFSFVGDEIIKLLEFIVNIKKLAFPGNGKINIADEELSELVLNNTQAQKLFLENEELFLDIAQNQALKKDVVALGYRRSQLEYFDQLLSSRPFFDEELIRTNKTGEDFWQAFFEKNKWIFGFGLSQVFLSSLQGKKLEQITRGHDLTGVGKRPDGVMKTQALINSLCFVEIKRHDTSLLTNTTYRSGVWAPSAELTGGVAQCHATVHSALSSIGHILRPTTADGDPTGEAIFNIEPRSYLILGSLNEFIGSSGIHEQKYRCFETYRRNVKMPEIITFDELLFRARFIVEHDE